jgi:hypothetical protein
VSPIVDVRGRILRQTNRVMFTVRSTAPAYWRLTSLNHFDGRIWSSSAEFRNADGTLPSSTDRTLTTRRVVQGFEIVGLGALWAPAAFEARELPQSSGPLLWDRDSSTLIVDDSLATSDGVTYTVASEVPVLDPSVLRAAAGSDPTEIRSTYLNLPLDLPERVRTEAEAVVAGLDSRYDQARALQDFFQSERFTYSTEVPEGHGNDALVAFLDSGAGYCEQFAGTYAAMARAVGVAGPGGRRIHPRRRRCRRPDLSPGARRARPRLARGLLLRHRLGSLRTHQGTRDPRGRVLHRPYTSPGARCRGTGFDHHHLHHHHPAATGNIGSRSASHHPSPSHPGNLAGSTRPRRTFRPPARSNRPWPRW